MTEKLPGRHLARRILLDGRKPIPAAELINRHKTLKGKKK